MQTTDNLINNFTTKARQLLGKSPTFPQKPGSILYSAASTLCKGSYYLMGYNPGGDPESIPTTILKSLQGLPQQSKNAYLDEDWSGYPEGESPFQLRVRYLLCALGEKPEVVCASNLIFARSRSAKERMYPGDADLCWPVHELILDIVQPKVILSIGNSDISAYAYIRNKMGSPTKHTTPARHGNWSVRAAHGTIGSHVMTVIGLPHLSRYAINGENKDEVIDWIRQQAGETRPAIERRHCPDLKSPASSSLKYSGRQ
ncbi:hypothetical protein [Ferrovum sp.]|jgi:hypothetical protein|uniref:hypothetical protein n=1 Tax=Ferrovum sp. TaxID=2609467 RepID=UPI002626D6F0|nr:hypothetical protein [Ferrovum sp.]